MTTLVRPVPTTIPVPRILSSAWHAFPKKFKRSTAEILHPRTLLCEEMKPASVGEGIEDGRPAVAETGEEHWAEVRRQWTKGFTARTEEEKQRDLAIQLEKTTMERLVGYYKKITNSRGTFTKPMPLSHLIAILVAGWKDAGLWPPESSLHEAILEKGLDPKDYNLSVHLSNVLDSDGPLEKEPHLPVSKILSRRNVTNRT